jgi:class 3 adenylate cyclase
MSEATSPVDDATDDLLQAGRDALGRHEWNEAFERLSAADARGPLSGQDLESLAQAAFFVARADLEREVKERAFKVYEGEGNDLRAAYIALDLARDYAFSGNHAISTVWIRRAERIIGPDGDTYAHGYLALIKSIGAGSRGDIETATTLAERAIEIGEGARDADLKAFGLINMGSLKIAAGDTTDGIAMMEEASISAVNGELSPFTTGVTACSMISACRDLTDYRRANEWIEATERYCHRQALTGFPGICKIHRAEIAAVGGAWERAEQDLEKATTELGNFNATPPQADGYYAIGDIRRLRGDFAGAEASLREAHARGRSPQPALALIRLAEGKVKAAATAIDAAVADVGWDRWARARLFPAQAEIAIAAGDLAVARSAVEALDEIVATYPSPALEAGRQATLGRVLLAEGDAAGAATALRAAVKGWREVGSPYEVARVRAVLSRALRAAADEDDADLELTAALEEFRKLGARVDIEGAERELRDAEDRRSGPVSARMTFMFTDIVGSTNLAEALGDQAWERLLRWHDDVLRNLITSGGGVIVNSTGDGFFAAFTSARAAVDAAVAIQRALRAQRDSSGFAIAVRIGLHTADANRRGDDYSGKGVHVAARVAAQGSGGEIVATTETLEEAGDVRAGPATPTVLKGVTEPVPLALVDWA